MVDNRYGKNPESSHNLLFNSELAKHEEELKNLEAELEENKDDLIGN